MRRGLPIWLLALAFVALAAVWSAVIPLGEGPDESGHAAYVFFLARERRLPVQSGEGGGEVPGEGHQPPLAYLLMAPLVGWLPPEDRAFDLPGNARFTWAGGPELNAVAHGSREHPPWRGAVLAWHLARLASVALGALTVGLTYLAARAFRSGHGTALLAAALVAFNPQFLFGSALITNDALLVTLCAALLWIVGRPPASDQRLAAAGAEERGGPQPLLLRRAAALGLILGLALLTKQSALLLAPVALLWCLAPPGAPAGALGQRLRGGALRAAVVAGAALAVCGWWYARNWRLYGDPLGLAAFKAEFTTQPFEASSPAAWLGALDQLHASFWARFGWMNVAPPAWVIWVFAAIELVALAGLLRWLMTGARRPAASSQRPLPRAGGHWSDGAWAAAGNGQRPTANRRGAISPSQATRRTPHAAPSNPPMQGHSGAPKAAAWPGSWSSALGAQAHLWPLLVLPALALAWVTSFAFTAGLVAWQGRLAFPALPAVAIGLARGLALAWPARWGAPARRGAGWGLALALAGLALWLPFGVIRPAYPFHTLPEEAALERLGTPVYGRFGKAGDPGAELRGWQISGTARPGATLELTLLWHALGRQNRDWTVFVHLVDTDDTIEAEDNRQPQDGAFPMTQWVRGDWVEDRHPLQLPATLAPGSYTLRVGLFDPRTGRRAGQYSERGKLRGDSLDLGQIVVVGQ